MYNETTKSCKQETECIKTETFVHNGKKSTTNPGLTVGDAIYFHDNRGFDSCYKKLQFDSVAIKHFKNISKTYNQGEPQENDVLFINGKRDTFPSCSDTAITIDTVRCAYNYPYLNCTLTSGTQFNVLLISVDSYDDLYDMEDWNTHSGTFNGCNQNNNMINPQDIEPTPY